MKFSVVASALAVFGSLLFAPSAQAQAMKLTNEFAGTDKCLDVVNDGKNDKLIMAKCGNSTGQAWDAETDLNTGYSRLKNHLTGDGKCLAIINDGDNHKLTMASCGNSTGQAWWLDIKGDAGQKAYFRITSKLTGPKVCLDIVNDGKNDQLTMDACDDVTGQIWYPKRVESGGSQ